MTLAHGGRSYRLLVATWVRWQVRRNPGAFADVAAYCLFLGHGRSGHSLIAALLDAHANMVVADELDTFAWLDHGFGRRHLFTLITASSARHAARGRRKGRGRERLYAYAVPGQFQGRSRALRVIGEARPVTARLHAQPAQLDRLRALVSVPVRFVQVVRNPFDSIARLQRVTGQPIQSAIDHYFDVCARTATIRDRLAPADVHLVRLEGLIARPETVLTTLCEFLGQPVTPDYLAACAGILFREPQRARTEVTWPPATIPAVTSRMAAYPFLAGYDFDA